MKTSGAILSAFLLAVIIVSATEAKCGKGCCVVYTKGSQIRRLHPSLIKEVRMQEVTGTCRIPAVVFITQRNRMICANPKAKVVKRIQKQLRERKNKTRDARRRKVKQ